eukprot:6174287-Pleurochrysis_carterae.AAC.1
MGTSIRCGKRRWLASYPHALAPHAVAPVSAAQRARVRTKRDCASVRTAPHVSAHRAASLAASRTLPRARASRAALH